MICQMNLGSNWVLRDGVILLLNPIFSANNYSLSVFVFLIRFFVFVFRGSPQYCSLPKLNRIVFGK